MKNKLAGMFLVAMIAAGGLGVTACSSSDSGSNSGSVSEQAQQAQDAVDSATQQGKEAVDQANKAVNDAKGAIDSMTLGLAKEVASEGIRVNAVRPGVIHTDIHAAGGEPDRVERVKASVPMGRGGQAEEIAEAILWLASEQASYTSGALLDVAGGR